MPGCRFGAVAPLIPARENVEQMTNDRAAPGYRCVHGPRDTQRESGVRCHVECRDKCTDRALIVIRVAIEKVRLGESTDQPSRLEATDRRGDRTYGSGVQLQNSGGIVAHDERV